MTNAVLAERIPYSRPFPTAGSDSEVVEMPLLLPRWQVVALEATARQNGLTTGQLIRRVINDIVSDTDSDHR